MAEAVPEPGWVRECPGGAFCFNRPEALKAQPVQAIDSLVGRYQGQGLTLSFDLGRHVPPLGQAQGTAQSQTIDGRPAQMLHDAKQASLLVPKIHPDAAMPLGMRMTLQAEGALPDGVALKIFQSINFKPRR